MLSLSPAHAPLFDDVLRTVATSLVAVCAGSRRNAVVVERSTSVADERCATARAVRELEHVVALAVGRGLVGEAAARFVAGLAYDVASQHPER